MGQKVNPIGLRTALTKDWDSRWFAGKEQFGKWLHEDLAIRKYIRGKFAQAAIARVKIERSTTRVRVTIFAARPGLLIGKKGAELDNLRQEIAKMTDSKDVFVDVSEIKRAEVNAQLVSENIALQLERRIGFRRAMKRAIQTAMEMGVDGIKIHCAGRLGGAELARSEQYKEGRVPLHTLKANIDYGFTEANTTAGKIGVKVWICHKEATEDQEYAINAKKSKVQKGSARK
ncbi:30S ribosomal protein S3 [Victivallis sp. Marseille-Q1083]|uniref:30S ribosomal protein S3 n=1 Tax=Victivallis sp. Marseille-Q1083 TaxID=2717288 RepID=UPI00158E703B|nr:30S ribosomal protein S3 [Victivallis sp. Marseille-Q1083]